jgi:hypothetical protein
MAIASAASITSCPPRNAKSGSKGEKRMDSRNLLSQEEAMVELVSDSASNPTDAHLTGREEARDNHYTVIVDQQLADTLWNRYLILMRAHIGG